MQTFALDNGTETVWPAFSRHVELMKGLANRRNVAWEMILDENGRASEDTVWSLNRLGSSILKHELKVADFSVMDDVREAVIANGVPAARLPQGTTLSSGWQNFIKAFLVHKTVVEQRQRRGVAALYRAARALASATIVEPWEIRAEDVNRLLAVAERFRKDARTICAYIDEQFLSRATPIRPLVPRAPKAGKKLASRLAERTSEQKLPNRDALYELVRIVWTEVPRDHFDHMRFLATRLLILTGLRINEVTYLPYDCLRTEALTVAATGASADTIGGNAEAMYLRYFAEKTKARATAGHLVEKRQYVPERFRAVVQQTVEAARAATEPLRTTLRRQFKAGCRHLWEFADEDVLQPNDFLSRLNRPDSNMRSEVGTKLTLLAPELPAELTAGYLEKAVSGLKRMKSDFRTFELNGEQINTADMLFLVPAANPAVSASNMGKYLAVAVLSDMQVSVGLGLKGRALSVFGRYSKEEHLKVAHVNPHSLRHLMNTELFRRDVSDTIITHHFGRESVAQSYEYDHRSLLERLDSVDLPGTGADILGGGSSEIVAKLVLGGHAEESHIAKSFRLIQKEHGNEVAFQYLKANADGFHVTPYGFCTNSFSMNPCSKHLKCFDNCSHFAASGSEEHRVSLGSLRATIADGRTVALSKPAKTTGRKNQIAHADTLIAGIDAALAATAGSCVFPGGVDHSSPKKDVFE
ncbi:hypothetical protein CBA19CS22_16320 [Caballeronia novacaledonica]|uniref:Uncharacterized protein n=1 Tax=Caballeronia novacaledonica TaxID=1544861 RepID=A0ACB5QTH7_9BURK|nr:hypothetical protein CBA19CS22_16320 [Caballeronia novacaledonica]